MGDFQAPSPSHSSSAIPQTNTSTSTSAPSSAFPTPHTLLLAIPHNPHLHTTTSYWAPPTPKSPLPKCHHAHSRLTHEHVRRLKHHTDYGSVTIPNIGFDLASYLHMQVLMLKMSSEDGEFVGKLVECLKRPGEEGRDAVQRERDMRVRIMSVRVMGGKEGGESLLHVVGGGDGDGLVWMWKVGNETGAWEESLEKAVLDVERRVGDGGGVEILVRGRDGVEQ